MLSDHVSVGGKSVLNQPTTHMHDLIGENMATRSNLTEEQIPIRSNAAMNFNQQEYKIEQQQLESRSAMQDDANKAYKVEPTS